MLIPRVGVSPIPVVLVVELILIITLIILTSARIPEPDGSTLREAVPPPRENGHRCGTRTFQRISVPDSSR